MAIYNRNLTHELLQLQFLISQLILRTTWHGKGVYNDPCCRILLCVNNILTTFCLPLRTVLSTRIMDMNRHGSVDYMGFLFEDIKKVQLQDGAYYPSAKPWREREVCHKNLYYWNIHDLMESYETITNEYELLLITLGVNISQYTMPGIIATMTESILNAIDLMIRTVNEPRGELRRLPRMHVNTVVCNIANILLNSLLILKTHSQSRPNFSEFASKYARQAQMHNSPGLENYYPDVLVITPQHLRLNLLEQARTQLPPRFIHGFPQDLIARIASYFCTTDSNTDTWSHYRTHQGNDYLAHQNKVNPPERRRKYAQRMAAWRDLCNFMSTCTLIQRAIKDERLPFNYDMTRERLIIEHMWQCWYKLQECTYIPPPVELEVWNTPPPPFDPRDGPDAIHIDNAPPDYLRHRWVTERLFKNKVTILADRVYGGALDPRDFPSVYPQLNPDAHNNPQVKPYDTVNHDSQVDYAEIYSQRIQRYLLQIHALTPEQQLRAETEQQLRDGTIEQELQQPPTYESSTLQLEAEENRNLNHLYDLHDGLPEAENETLSVNMETEALQVDTESERVKNDILEYETLTQQSMPYCQRLTCNGDCTTCTEMQIARDIGYEQGLQKGVAFLSNADFQSCSTNSARLLHAYNLGLQDAQQEHLNRDNPTNIPSEQHYDALQLQLHHDIHHTESAESMNSDEKLRRANAERELAFWHQNTDDSDSDTNSRRGTRQKSTSHRSTAYDSDNDTKPPARKSPKHN